jgi:DNA polymerase-1
MFYGIPAKIYNKRGRTIHATLGFVSALQRMIKTYRFNRCAVVFDGDCSEERKELCEEYKANRPQDWDSLPKDENPFLEEEYIRDCLQYLGICMLESKGMEADDLIASMALRESGAGEVVIASYDSDFFQLINDKISVLRYRGEHTKIMDKSAFETEFAFPPSRYALYKSLTGDTSDNVTGVPSIGKKRAAQIVQHYADYEALKSGKFDFLPNKARENLQNALPTIERNLSLIVLKERAIQEYQCCFDSVKISETNSKILTACRVFD